MVVNRSIVLHHNVSQGTAARDQSCVPAHVESPTNLRLKNDLSHHLRDGHIEQVFYTITSREGFEATELDSARAGYYGI